MTTLPRRSSRVIVLMMVLVGWTTAMMLAQSQGLPASDAELIKNVWSRTGSLEGTRNALRSTRPDLAIYLKDDSLEDARRALLRLRNAGALSQDEMLGMARRIEGETRRGALMKEWRVQDDNSQNPKAVAFDVHRGGTSPTAAGGRGIFADEDLQTKTQAQFDWLLKDAKDRGLKLSDQGRFGVKIEALDIYIWKPTEFTFDVLEEAARDKGFKVTSNGASMEIDGDRAFFDDKHLLSSTRARSALSLDVTRPSDPASFGAQLEHATASGQEPEYARSARPGQESAPLAGSLEGVLENITKGSHALLEPLPDSEDAELLLAAGSKDVLRSFIATRQCPPKPPFEGVCKTLDDVRKMREAPSALGWGNPDETQRVLRQRLGASLILAERQFEHEFAREKEPPHERDGLLLRLKAASAMTDELRREVEEMEARLTRMAARFETIEVIGGAHSDALREVLGDRTAREFSKQQMDRLRQLREAVKALETRTQTTDQQPAAGAPATTARGPATAGPASGNRGRDVPRRTPPPAARLPIPAAATTSCEPVTPPDSVKPLVFVIHGIGELRDDGWSDQIAKAWDIGTLEEISFRYPGRTFPASLVDFAPMAGDWALQVQTQLKAKIQANPDRPIVIVSHSWGSVATAMALMGGVGGGTSPALVGQDYGIGRIDLGGRRIAQWITLGSPLGRSYAPVPLNLRQLQVAAPTGKPDQVDEWTNFYDVEDLVANLSHDLEGATNIALQGSASLGDQIKAEVLREVISRVDFTGIVADSAASLGRGVAAHMGSWYNPVVRQHVRETYWALDPSYGLVAASDEAVENCFAETVKKLKAEENQYQARRREAVAKLEEQLATLAAATRKAEAALPANGHAFQLALRMKDHCTTIAGLMPRLDAIATRMATGELLVEARLERAHDLANACADRAALVAAAAAHSEAAGIARRIAEDYASAAALAAQLTDARNQIGAIRKELDAIERSVEAMETELATSSGADVLERLAPPTDLRARILLAESRLARNLAAFRAQRIASTDADPDAVARAERLQMYINTLTSLGESLRQVDGRDGERTRQMEEAASAAQTSRRDLADRLARLRVARSENECSDTGVDPRAMLDQADTSRTLSDLAMSKLGAGYQAAAAACADKLNNAGRAVASLLAEIAAVSRREQTLTDEIASGRARLTSWLQELQQRMGPACAVMRRSSSLSSSQVVSAERDAERVELLLTNASTAASTCRDAKALDLADQSVLEAQRLTAGIERLASTTAGDPDAMKEARREIQAEQPALAQAINLWARIRERFDEAGQLASRYRALRAQLQNAVDTLAATDVARLAEFDRIDAGLSSLVRDVRADQAAIERDFAQFAECQRLSTAEASALEERLDTAKVLAQLALSKLGQGYKQAADACRAKMRAAAGSPAGPPGAPAPPARPAAATPSKETLLKDIVTTTRQITITVWDTQCEDGDRITVRVNGTPVFENHTLFKRQESRTITLPSDDNTIEVFANNGGTDCPPGETPLDMTVNSGAITVSGDVTGRAQTWQVGQQRGTTARLVVDPTRAAEAAANAPAGGATGSAPGGVAPSNATGVPQTLRVATVSGTVSHQSPTGVAQPLGPNSRVGPGTNLQTGTGSQLGLQADGGTSVTLGPDTQVQLPTPPAKKIKLLRGTIDVTHGPAASHRDGAPDFDGVETTDVGLTHRGTKYRVQAGASGTLVEVTEGAVHLTGQHIIKRYKVAPSENAPKVGPAREVELVAGQSAFAMRVGSLTDEVSSGTRSTLSAAPHAAGGSRTGAGAPVLPPFVPAPARAADSAGGSAPPASAVGGPTSAAVPSWLGAAPATSSTASALTQPDPWNSSLIQQLMDEWLRTAIAASRPDGIVLRYNEWAQPLSQAARSTGAPDHPADWTRHRYLWETRAKWTSINLCSMGEFVERRVSSKTMDGCATGVPTWVASTSTRQEAASGLKGNSAIQTARDQLEVVRKQEEDVRRREQQRRLDEQRRVDEERRIAEVRRLEQEKLDASRRLAEERRLAELRKVEEQQRIARQKEGDDRRRRERADKVKGFMESFVEGLTQAVAANQPGAAASGGATVQDRPLQDIVVTSRRVTLTVWDDACEDGDRITVRINGQAVVDNHELFKQKESIPVTLPFDTNTIEVIAVNGGTDCSTAATDPATTINTGAIGISNATTGASQTWLLRQRASTVARIVVQP